MPRRGVRPTRPVRAHRPRPTRRRRSAPPSSPWSSPWCSPRPPPRAAACAATASRGCASGASTASCSRPRTTRCRRSTPASRSPTGPDIPEQLQLGIRGFLLDTYYAHRQPDGTVVADPGPTPAGGCTSATLASSGPPRSGRPVRAARPRPAQPRSTCSSSTTRTTSRRATSRARSGAAGWRTTSTAARPGRGGRRCARWPGAASRSSSWPSTTPVTALVPRGLPGDPAGDPVHLRRHRPADRPGAVGHELPPEPRGPDRLAVPHEPLVAAVRAEPGDLRGRQRRRDDRGAGRGRAGRSAASCRR